MLNVTLAYVALRCDTQYIAIGLEWPAITVLSSGVPQGFILGQLLFAMYVSPIDEVALAPQMQYRQYADSDGEGGFEIKCFKS